MTDRRLTFVTTYDPRQSDLGGASWVDTALLEALGQSFAVDVHQICGEGASGRVPLEIRSSKRLLGQTLLRMLFLKEPYQVAKFRVSAEWKREVRKVRSLAENRSHDHLIVTSQWPALLLLADAGVHSDLHIAHNVDTVIARSHDPALFRWIGNPGRMADKEQEILRRPRSVVAISQSDSDRIERWGIECRHLTLAPKAFRERTPSSTVVGFIGKATWPPNAQAIGLLVDDVLPRVRKTLPTASVVLSGRGTEKWADVDGVTSLGRIDDLADFYDMADLVVVPRLGESTGVSVKMLEAITFGRPVVVPSMLAADAGLEAGVILAEDVNEMVMAITEYFGKALSHQDHSVEPDTDRLSDSLTLADLDNYAARVLEQPRTLRTF